MIFNYFLIIYFPRIYNIMFGKVENLDSANTSGDKKQDMLFLGGYDEKPKVSLLDTVISKSSNNKRDG